MKRIAASIVQRIGMDKSIAYSSGSRIVQGITGVCSIFFISTYLTGVEQGFYYTIGSILALQVFFELGLTGIMTQYVAHEVSHLTLNDNYEYDGEFKYRSRLASLVHFCVKWYSILSLIVFFFLLIAGYTYFVKFGENIEGEVSWRKPWILVCAATGLNLFISPLTSILTGLGFVKETSKIGFYRQIIMPLCLWVGLIFGLKLYVVGLSVFFSIFVWVYFIIKQKLYPILKKLWNEEIDYRVDYFSEIFPYQWKIALSWISGYFIFQLFNPVLFATEGAVVAGQMGMTLTALNSISAFSMSWLNTKIPLYSRLIALKDYVNLDLIHKKTMFQMLSICTLLLLLFQIMIFFLNFTQFAVGKTILSERFLTNLPIMILTIPLLINLLDNSWATYLRCHKKEPYLFLSVLNGLLCMCSTLIVGPKYGLYGIIIGYCIIQLSLIFWYYLVYVNKKKEWHG